jgi:hypothetical protein
MEALRSLAAHPGGMINSAGAPLTQAALRNAVEQRLNPASALNPAETSASVIRDMHQGPSPRAPQARSILSSSLQALQNPNSIPTSRNEALRTFADALVERGDGQLAIALANNLIYQRLNAENRLPSSSKSLVAVAPDSTFGHAWNELADALHSEPFKSFAEAKGIDVSTLLIEPDQDLPKLSTPHNANLGYEYAAASANVFAAAKKVVGQSRAPISLRDRKQAPADVIARFYGLELGNIFSNNRLLMIGQLLREGNFSALSSSAPLQQQQREARQRIVDLPPHPLNERLAQFAPMSVAQKVQEADQALAQLCSQALIKLIPETGSDTLAVMLDKIPEYSTFHQVRKNLLDALTGEAFTDFAAENNLEPTSVRINPLSATLTGKANGIDTTFTLNDISGWTDVWKHIKPAVQQAAAGADSSVGYPNMASVSLDEVIAFYNEKPAASVDTRQPYGDRLQLIAILGRSADIHQQDGFRALVNTDATDTPSLSLSVRERQREVIHQLSGKPILPSAIEHLAAAVKRAAAPLALVETPIEALGDAESRLAIAVHRAMLELSTDATNASSKTIESIPPNSLFGQWRAYLGKALNSRGFIEWANRHHVEISSMRFDPTDKAVVARVNGVDQRFTAADFTQRYPEYFDVLAPVLTAAEIFSAPGKPITLTHANGSRAPFEWVANFYSISTQYGTSTFAQDTERLGRTRQFPTPPEHPEKVITWLKRQRTALGDSNDRFALIEQLKNANTYNDHRTRFIVDADSSHKPKGVTTLQKFLANQGWYPATTAGETDNLLRALQTQVPQSPALGNNWGFLSTPLPLTGAQHDTVSTFISQAIAPQASLLGYLGANIPQLSTDPAQALDQLLSSATAVELASTLQTKMNGAGTAISLRQWLLTALVLELDSAAGTTRNAVAGYDFMKPENWGRPAHEISKDFAQHLVATHKATTEQSSIAAYVLMSGAAPAFLVRDLPQTLTYGSAQWAIFHTAVTRVEQLAPGATRHMSFKQVMDFNQIKPLSRAEEVQLLRAQMNPCIDWGIANGVIERDDKDHYTLEQLNTCVSQLGKQTTEVAQAKRYITHNPVPVRRSLALENLKQRFGTQIPYETRALTGDNRDTQGVITSVVEAYEAGKLADTYTRTNLIELISTSSNTPAWHTRNNHIPIQLLHDHAADLPDVNAQYDTAIENDFGPRRDHSIVIIRDLLSKLPAQDRRTLAFDKKEYYSVRESDTSVWHAGKAKKGKKGSHGLIIRTTDDKGNVTDFGLFPDAGIVKKLPGLPNPMPTGGTNAAFGNIYDGRDEGAHSLQLDFTAFSSPAAPREGTVSDVIIDRIPPMSLENGELINKDIATFGTPDNTTAPGYFDERFKLIAEIAVDSHLLRKDEYKAINRGYNPLEEKAPTFLERLDTLARMIPGVSSIEDIYQGHYVDAGRDLFIDALSLLIPEGLGKVWSTTARAFERAATGAGETLVQSAVEDGIGAVGLKNLTAANTSHTFTATRRMQGSLLAEPAEEILTPKAELTDGLLMRPGNSEQINVTAINQDNKWYAYDAKTLSAYGVPLEGFVPEAGGKASLPKGAFRLKPETNAQGVTTRVPEGVSGRARLLKRQTHTDIVIGEKVYRYDPKKPEVMTEVGVAPESGALTDFEGYCPAPSSRVRRDLNSLCFAKWIEPNGTWDFQEAQALEHRRLTPGQTQNGQSRTVVHDHRLYEASANGGDELIPIPSQHPISYRNQVKGRLVDEPDFGFDEPGKTRLINNDTLVIQLDQISDASNDTRTLRAVKVDFNGQPYLVAEGDTGVFFYAALNTQGGDLEFYRITANNNPTSTYLINAHDRYKDTYGFKPNNDVVVLPTMDELTHRVALENQMTPEEILHLQLALSGLSGLSEEKQREILLNIYAWGRKLNIPTALKPIGLSPIIWPTGFTTLTQAEQNQFYAEAARKIIDDQFEATGIKWGNQRIPNNLADDARNYVAKEIVTWLYTRTNAPNYSEVIMKVGAGNCDQMAKVAVDTINLSAGDARIAQVQGHTFAVVGGPTGHTSTDFFSEPEWADAWIVDPWSKITCKASDYRAQFLERMQAMSASGQEILISDGGTPPQGIWVNPMDPAWINPATHGSVRVF